MDIVCKNSARCMGGVEVMIMLLKTRHVEPYYHIEVKHGRTHLMRLQLNKCELEVAQNRFNKIAANWKRLASEKDCYNRGGCYD